MKILYVSQYFPPEMGAPSARASELARHWQADGHDVTVLTGFPNHPTGVVPETHRKKLRRLVVREQCNGANIVRTWLWPLPNRQAHERILNYSSFCISSAITGLFVKKPEVVIATSPQLLVALSGYWLARAKRVPFVFEVRDLWPESLVAVGQGSESSALNRTLSRIAGFLYRHAYHIVVVTPAFKDHLISRWLVPEGKISVVENGVETEIFSPAAPQAERKSDLIPTDRFIICYIGTMGMAHGLETLLLAAQKLQTTFPAALFLLIGEGAEKARIQALAASQGLQNIQFLDQQPRELIPSFIGAADATLVLLKKTELFKTVIPTKMLEFMSCARPVILGVDGQARSILEAANAGIFIEPENADALAQAILWLAQNPALRAQLGANGRKHIVQNFSRAQTAKAYTAILRNVIGEKGEVQNSEASLAASPITAQR